MKKLMLLVGLLSGCTTQSNDVEETTDVTAEPAQNYLKPGDPGSPVTVPAELTPAVHPLFCQSCVSNLECSDSTCGIFCIRSGGFGGSCGRLNP